MTTSSDAPFGKYKSHKLDLGIYPSRKLRFRENRLRPAGQALRAVLLGFRAKFMSRASPEIPSGPT
ncbi:hypothetical protein SAMN05216525_13288 [Bradyrhizobium sp. Gha]|nr:hypothetical protein SAMN05216525_13288 [Bradyrhizobium sp. Gha]